MRKQAPFGSRDMDMLADIYDMLGILQPEAICAAEWYAMQYGEPDHFSHFRDRTVEWALQQRREREEGRMPTMHRNKVLSMKRP